MTYHREKLKGPGIEALFRFSSPYLSSAVQKLDPTLAGLRFSIQNLRLGKLIAESAKMTGVQPSLTPAKGLHFANPVTEAEIA